MTQNKRILKVLLTIVCCAVIILAPAYLNAQVVGGIVNGAKKGVQKGAHAVQKGVEGAVDTTKEGAEAVGKGVKKTFTDDDNDTSNDRMKDTDTTSGVPNRSAEPSQGQRGTAGKNNAGKNNLPRTAGELPLLALAGILSLAGAGASRIVRRKRSSNISGS